MKKTRRYCVKCKKVTTFKCKKKSEHSKCAECGGWRAGKRLDKKVQKQRCRKYPVKIIEYEFKEEIEK